MATHDYVIANQNGANFRSDLNNVLSAIVSNNSSATAPTDTYAYMWWADTGNDRLKLRNGADSDWVEVLVLSTGVPVFDGNVDYDDNEKARFGDAQDLEIYHNGTNSIIEDTNATSTLIIKSDYMELNASDDTTYATFTEGGSSVLNYNDSARLTTTADGVDIEGTGSLKLPVGTTAQQPTSPTAGDLRWNSDDTSAEIYDGSAWGAVGGGGAATTVYSEHAHTLSENTEIASGNNAISGGPITIDSGYSVTVPTGSTWTIV